MDDADGGDAVVDEGDGDAEHGEQVRVVDGTVQWVDAPGGVGGRDEIVAAATCRVSLLADELVVGIAFGYRAVDERFDVCGSHTCQPSLHSLDNKSGFVERALPTCVCLGDDIH